MEIFKKKTFYYNFEQINFPFYYFRDDFGQCTISIMYIDTSNFFDKNNHIEDVKNNWN